MLNNYIRKIIGHSFTAKDFRTWGGHGCFFDTLMDIGMGKNVKTQHRNILIGYDAAAAHLGNTRNVCRKYYVHPFLLASYEDGFLAQTFKNADSYKSKIHFSTSEKAILEKSRTIVRC